MDEQLLAYVTNKTTSDELLLQSISRLGPVNEPAEFWTRIANDAGYSDSHRRRAIFALFRRHCYGVVKSLGEALRPANWLSDDNVLALESEVRVGPMPMIEINDRDTIFDIRVLGGWSIFVRVAGKMDRNEFSQLLRGERVDPASLKSDGVILQIAYGDDYEQWLQRNAFFAPKQKASR